MVDPITAEPPRPVRRAVFQQHWRDLTFVHWPVAPAAVAPLLPAGTEPDVLDGVTWVGLVPFVMSSVRVLGTPPLPHLSGFPETNVRLYAVDGQGRRGVVFASLEAARLLPVVTARATYHLPYMWAAMRVRRDGDRMTYATRRRWPGPRGVASTVDVRIGQPVEAGDLEHFLTARWGLFSTWYDGRSVWAPVEHRTWPLHSASLLALDDELVSAAGIEVSGPPHVLWSPGVEVRIGRPERLAAAARRSRRAPVLRRAQPPAAASSGSLG